MRNRAVRAAWPVAAIAVATVAAIVVVGREGAGAPIVGRTVALVLLVLAAAAVLGVLAVVALVPTVGDPARSRALDTAAAAAAVWAVTSAVVAVLLFLADAPPIGSAAFGPGLVAFLEDVPVGRTWLIAAIGAALLTALVVAVRSRAGVLALWGVSAVVAAPVALQAALDDPSLAAQRTILSGDLMLLLSTGTWLGALLTAVVLRVRSRVVDVLGVLAASAAAIALASSSSALQRTGSMSVAVGSLCLAVAAVLAVTAVRRPSSAGPTRGPQSLLVAAAVGIAIGAMVVRAAPPTQDRTAPAAVLTGSTLPTVPSPASALLAWQPDPLWIVVAVLLLVLHLAVTRRAGGRSRGRPVSWVLGLLVLVWTTNGAPAVYAPVLLGAHLLQHVLLLLVVPLLLALGAPGRLAAVASLRSLDRRPVVAAVPAAVVTAGLYGTSALRWSVADPVGAEVATICCLVAGCVLVVGVRSGGGAGAAVAAVLLVLETAAAGVLAVSPSLLLADWWGAMGWGTDALAAQRSASLPAWILAAIPTAVLLALALRGARARTATGEAVA